MFERFTERARKVLAIAGREAQRLHHGHIGTEHILLGLLKEKTGVAATVLQQRGISTKVLSQAIADAAHPDPETDAAGTLPQTMHAKHVIQGAIEEARALHHNYLGTEHLLLALLRETEGVADRVLVNLGLGLADLRQDVLCCLGESASAASTVGPLSPESAREVLGAAGTKPGALLKHVVMWTLKGDKQTQQVNASTLKTRLEALPAAIPEIQSLEVGLNQAQSDAACDVVLITAFKNDTDLKTYQEHPTHQEVVTFVREVCDQRYVVDYQG